MSILYKREFCVEILERAVSKSLQRSMGLAELAHPYEFQMLPNLFWISEPFVTQMQRLTGSGNADSVLPAGSALPYATARRSRLQWVCVKCIYPQ